MKINMGKKRGDGELAVPEKRPKNEVTYPSMSMYDMKDLPFTEDDAGKTFKITGGTLRVVRVGSNADAKRKTKDATLEVMELEVEPRKGRGDLGKTLSGKE